MATFSEPNDTLTDATPTSLRLGSFGAVSFSGAIGDRPDVNGLDVDLFEIQLEEGDRLIADIDADVVGTGLDSILQLFNASGEEVDVNHDFDGFDSLIDFTAVESDTYFVGVSGFSNFDYNPVPLLSLTARRWQ